MLRKATKAIYFFLLAAVCPVLAAAGTPDWLRSLAQQPPKKYADDVNAVVLVDDQEVTVRDAGDIVTHERIAFRILRPEGKEYAELGLHFDNETKIGFLHGWSITAKGQEYEAKEKDAVERSLTSDEIFSDVKYKILALPGADVGTVIGFEFEQKDRPFLFQDFWQFQRRIPVEHSKYTLHLPAGWEYRANWINHAEQSPVEQNGAYVWEVRDVSHIQHELRRPPDRALAGTMIVTFFSEKIKSQTFRTWNDLGLWYSQLTAGTRQPSPALQQAVQQLAPASLPLFDRIRALARFAQRDVRYAAIEVGIGGLKPHPAADVFAHRYGDCKDKATVLSTMLAQIGVKSFYMPIHDERGIYTDKTPPNRGFDHVILAIQLTDGTYAKPLPAMYEHIKLGHLLIFDPTNEVVPLGQLPAYEQDSFALLVTDDGGELIHLPLSKPELNRITRTAKLALLPDGSVKGEVEEVQTGSMAAASRMSFADQTAADRRKTLERFLGKMVGNFQLDRVDADNLDDIDKDLIIRYKFTAEHYAKNAGPLLLVRPRVLGEKIGALDSTKPRHYPYEFDVPTLQTDTFQFDLPDGYKVDELPEAAKADFTFAEYSSRIENDGATLKYTREYRVKATSVPAERIGDLSKFFREINQDERNMAVLKKAN
jgi:hypothetical protein